jgi:membrane AbrB-like protein
MVLIALAGILGLTGPGLPAWYRIVIQSVVGGFIGRRINRSALESIRRMLPVVFMTTSWYMAGTALLGWLVSRGARIDLGTAILATVPGGVTEMTALAISSKVDVAFVAAMQTMRVLAANILVPLAVRSSSGRQARENRDDGSYHRQAGKVVEETAEAAKVIVPHHWILGLLASLAGGFILTYAAVPAGGIMGSMLAIALIQFAGIRIQPVPKAVLTLAYISLGISVGSAFDTSTLAQLKASAGILVLTTAATLASSFLLAIVVRKTMNLDHLTAILACSPGGLSLMAVVAEEIGVDSATVSFLHLTRIVWIILAMPILLRVLT